MGIGHREGVTSLPVPGAEPSLEVHAPSVIWRHNRPEGLLRGHCAAMATPWLTQSFTAQQVADRARCWPGRRWRRLSQHRQQLTRPPERTRPSQRQQSVGHLLRHRPTMPVRRAQRLARANLKKCSKTPAIGGTKTRPSSNKSMMAIKSYIQGRLEKQRPCMDLLSSCAWPAANAVLRSDDEHVAL
jgi:hypothetical protein